MSQMVRKVREIQIRASKNIHVQTPHLCVLVTRESCLQGTGDGAGKGVSNVLSIKTNPSCTSLYLSFVHPKLLLLCDPCRIYYSLSSLGYIASAESAVK